MCGRLPKPVHQACCGNASISMHCSVDYSISIPVIRPSVVSVRHAIAVTVPVAEVGDAISIKIAMAVMPVVRPPAISVAVLVTIFIDQSRLVIMRIGPRIDRLRIPVDRIRLPVNRSWRDIDRCRFDINRSGLHIYTRNANRQFKIDPGHCRGCADCQRAADRQCDCNGVRCFHGGLLER